MLRADHDNASRIRLGGPARAVDDTTTTLELPP